MSTYLSDKWVGRLLPDLSLDFGNRVGCLFRSGSTILVGVGLLNSNNNSNKPKTYSLNSEPLKPSGG